MFTSRFTPVKADVVDARPLLAGPILIAFMRLSGVVLGLVLQTGNSLKFPPDPDVTHTSRWASSVHVFLKTSREVEFENTL